MKDMFNMVGIDPEKDTIADALASFEAKVVRTMKIMPEGRDGKPIGLLLICGADDAQKISDLVDSIGDE